MKRQANPHLSSAPELALAQYERTLREEEYLSTLAPGTVFLFPSSKTKQARSERALGYIVKKYAASAKLTMDITNKRDNKEDLV